MESQTVRRFVVLVSVLDLRETLRRAPQKENVVVALRAQQLWIESRPVKTIARGGAGMASTNRDTLAAIAKRTKRTVILDFHASHWTAWVDGAGPILCEYTPNVYVADATKIEPGSIVKVENPHSSSGRPTYSHFFIVLSVPEAIRSGDVIPLVGVSSRIDSNSADPAKHVQMKWLNRKGGDPETGFSTPCYASMDFTHLLEVYEGKSFRLEVAAEHRRKFVRADKLQTIVATMNAWTRRPRS